MTLPKLTLFAVSLFTLHLSLFASTPTILSTDIGGDVDDTWALAHLLRSPELDLKMVLTETGDSQYRASVTAKLLEVANRTDVHVALGTDFGPFKDSDKHQAPWVTNYELSSYPGTVHQEGVQAFIDYVKNSPAEEIKVIAIGPAPSLAAAISKAPEIAKKCRLYSMHGSFDIGYNGSAPPTPEYNVYADVPAFRTLMGAPWKSITLTPLDTCGRMILDGENYHEIWCATDDPLLRAVIENYCLWAPRVPWMKCDFFTQKSSTLFDDVAVFMAYSDKFINYEEIQFSVSDKGDTIRDPDGPYRAQVAITWKDMAAFQDFLTNRLLNK